MNEDVLSTLQQFITSENILKLILGIIVISVIVSIVRSVIRLAMPIVVIGLVMVVFLGYTPDSVINFGKKMVTYGTTLIQDNIPFSNNEDSIKTEKQQEKNNDPTFQQGIIEDRLKSFLNQSKEKNVDQMFIKDIGNTF